MLEKQCFEWNKNWEMKILIKLSFQCTIGVHHNETNGLQRRNIGGWVNFIIFIIYLFVYTNDTCIITAYYCVIMQYFSIGYIVQCIKFRTDSMYSK